MRPSILLLAAAAVASAVTATSAEEPVIKGVYLRSKALCAQAKKETLQPVIEAGNMVLTNRGIDAIEYNCAFVQFLKHPRLDNAWVATAFCEEPDISKPDVFSILRREPGSLEIASLEESSVENGGEDAVVDVPAETAGEGAADAPAPQPSPDEAAPEDEASFATIGGTYYLCDGVTMP